MFFGNSYNHNYYNYTYLTTSIVYATFINFLYGIMHDKLSNILAPLFNEDVLFLGSLKILHLFRSSVQYNVWPKN